MIGVGSAGPIGQAAKARARGRASERECWIALSCVPGVGPAGFARLLARHGSAAAAAMQAERQRTPNTELPPGSLDERNGFGPQVQALLDTRARQLGLSMRRLHRAARVARTIADLAGSAVVRAEHLDEALVHRPKEVRV